MLPVRRQEEALNRRTRARRRLPPLRPFASAGSARIAGSRAAVEDAPYDAFISYSHAVDGKLAPAIQSGLHRFAKPWYRLRALRVFRDETSLSATPELWPSIVAALDASRWLIVLASPDAAESRWVNDELEHWCAAKSTSRLIVAVTSDDVDGDFDWETTKAVPPAIQRAFADKSPTHLPRVVDLRWASGLTDVSLANARFRDAIADIACAIHGRPKDVLYGEDVRQHQKTRRLVHGVLASLAILLAAAVVAAVTAVTQRERALSQRDRAEQQARLALSRQLAAEADSTGNDHLDRGLLLAAQSYATVPTAEARASLLRTLLRSPHLVGVLPGTAGATRVAFGPRGKLLAVGGRHGEVALWSPEQRREIKTLRRGLGGAVTSLAFSGDGDRLAVGGKDGRVDVWDVARGASLAHWVMKGRQTSVALNGRGTVVAAATANGQTTSRTIGSSRSLATFRIRQPFVPPLAVAVRGDGTIALGDSAGQLMLWDPRTHVSRWAARGVPLIGPPSRSTYSPGLRRFVGVWPGRPDVRTPDVIELGTPRRDRLLKGPAMAVDAMAFNRDGQMLATAGEGRVILWSLRLRRALEDTFDGAPGHASAVTFSANGRYIAVAAQRGVAVWDRRKLALLRSLKTRDAVLGHVAPAQKGTPSAAFSPDARLLAWSLSTARRIVVWRLADHREILRFPGARAVAFSPDGKQLAASVDYFPSDFIVVNVATGERTRMKELPWATGRSASAAAPSERPWTSDGGKGVGASAALDGTVTLWDTRRSQPIATLRAPGTLDRPFLVFDRAGQKLAIATAGGAMTLMDLVVKSWRGQACRLAARTLTASEWRNFVGTHERERACPG